INNLIDPNRFWSFVARAPESIHFVVHLYSDAGTAKSLRHISGHSVNTYVWRNAEGNRKYVKYHWYPFEGVQYITSEEANKLAAENPDYSGKDLYDAIANGKPVEYGLYVQLMDPKDEAHLSYDPLDDTKVWDEKKYPLIPVGKMVLNKNPENYMEQVEKVAFSPSNLLDGAELSDDKMLQGRANIYSDSQRRRIGSEFRKLAINKQQNWTPANQITSGDGRYVEGKLERTSITKQDDFTQPTEFYTKLKPIEKEHLAKNLASDLKVISDDIRKVVLEYFHEVSADLARRIESAMQRF
ncbi:catalase, partial [Bacillus wiedmannii]|uniref:catalase n=1 Tax=Bacillus wiedmannii TaxID=1890302 RepID=UPI002E22E4C2|nr:catalase [Bacillus wiedmannii]